MLSSKTRLQVNVLVAIASAPPTQPVTVQALAGRLQVSVSHMETIAGALRQAGLVRSVRGPGGGYHLDCDPQSVTIGEAVQRLSASAEKPRVNADSPIATLEAGIHDTLVNFLSSRTIAEFATTDQSFTSARTAHISGLRPNPMHRNHRPPAPNSVFELGAFALLRAA